MVASRQVEIPFYRSIGRQRVRGFGALFQVIGRTAIPLLRKQIVPDAHFVGADSLKFAVPEIAKVFSGRKTFKTAAKIVGRQTLRKQLGSGSRKKSASRVIQTKTAIQTSRSREVFLKAFLFFHVEYFSEQEVPVSLVTHVTKMLHSSFSNVEVYMNSQHIYNIKGMYAHQCYISNNFEGAIFEKKWVLLYEGYDYDKFVAKIMESPLSKPFFTRRTKMLSRPIASCCRVEWVLTFSPLPNCYIQS